MDKQTIKYISIGFLIGFIVGVLIFYLLPQYWPNPKEFLANSDQVRNLGDICSHEWTAAESELIFGIVKAAGRPLWGLI